MWLCYNLYLNFVHAILYYNCFIFIQYGLHDVSIVIIGNKCDLEDKRVVPMELGEQVGLSKVSAFMFNA